MDGATGGVTRQVQYFFDDTQGISPLENLARGGRLRIFPVIHPSNHPKENVRQLLREWADIWCAYRYAELWQGYKAVLVVDDGRMLVLLDDLSESRFFLVS